jgi:hypothetical protein
MISIDTKQAALAEAIQASPRESCGLVVLISGKELYWPCRNIAIDDSDFNIHPQDYCSAARAGKIIAVIHSHPNGFPLPTDADLACCETSGLPWYIVSPHLDEPLGRWHGFQPSGFRAPLMGREWVWGVHDCWALVRDWYADHGLSLRDFERPTDPNDFLQNPLFEALFTEAGFCEVPRATILPGDLALMSFRSKGLNHIGVFDENLCLLHHIQGRLSRAEIYGEGLQRSTGKVIRHLEYKRLRFY